MSADYNQSRSMFGFLKGIGWVLVIAGLVVALIGFANPPRYGGFGARLVLMAPGISIFVSGVFLVAFAHVGQAIVDMAENSGRVLRILERETGAGSHSRPPVASKPAERAASSSRIEQVDGKYRVGEKEFEFLSDAKAYLESTTKDVIGFGNGCFYVRGVRFETVDEARQALADKSGTAGEA